MTKQKIKCLIAIVNRDKGNLFAQICQQHDLYFCYATLALGTANNELQDYLGIGETDKELVFCFLPAPLENTIMHEIATKINIRKPGHGIMFTISLSGISSLFQQNVLHERSCKEDEMVITEHKFELIVAVVNHGYKDQVMDAAKSAKATGGTVLHARSLQNDEAASFFGIKLQGEKDIVIILSTIEIYKDIMKTINITCGLKSEARGLIFSLPVDNFIGM